MRIRTVLAATALAVGLLAAPAAAHNLEVSPRGNETIVTGWVGSPALPSAAGGKGLIPGGPTGSYRQSPSHALGLNTACTRLEGNPSAVDIRGPGGPGCAHGS